MIIQDQIIFDGVTKNATIMRDGIYHYLGREVGDFQNPSKIVRVFRDRSEIEKAYKRFLDLQRIPLTVNHPKDFISLEDENSYNQGIAIDPSTKMVKDFKVLNCRIDLKDQALEYYSQGKKELSCGWSGSFSKVEHSDYDYTQHFEDFNHIAILPNGRGGSLCSITDNNLNILNMDIDDLKLTITDTIKSVLDEYAPKKKKKAKSQEGEEGEEGEDLKKNNDELVEKLATAIHSLKSEQVEQVKEVDEVAIKDEAVKETIKDFDCVLKAIEKGAIEVKDCLGKSPLEIKKQVVKTIAKKEIEDSKIDAYFDISLENFKHPSWEKKAKIVDKESEKTLVSLINNINFLDKQ
jgi:hypothetical protein